MVNEARDDRQFYDSCCSGNWGGCELFYSRRAIGTCDGYSPPAGGMMPTTGGMEIGTDEMIMQRTAPCRKHYKNDKKVILDDSFSNPVQQCPCTLRQARNDPRFMIDTMFRPDSTCYIQRSKVSGFSPGGPISYGQQCCYDINNG